MLSITVPIFVLVLAIVLIALYFTLPKSHEMRNMAGIGAGIAIVATIVTFVMTMIISIPAGHVGVATLFGSVQQEAYPAGMHLANPLYEWRLYDSRMKTHSEKALVPSQDQLLTTFDVSVQYRLDPEQAPKVLQETGNVIDVLNVHLIPKLRSVLREQGKSVENAEDFYLEDVQERLQGALSASMQEFLYPRGVIVSSVLLRDIQLPKTIQVGVEAKKQREQEAERQKAELRRFETEQKQKIAQATIEREAAEQVAIQRKLLADAKAYEIEKINAAIAQNPAYIKLEALKALEAISMNPATKIYFLDGKSPSPLPLMHIGDTEISTK